MPSTASLVACARLPLSAMLVATALLAPAPTVLGQDDGGSALSAQAAASLQKSLGDFVHYVLIGKPDLAQAAAEGVLGASVSDAALAALVDEGDLAERLDRAVSRSRSMGEVSDFATRIASRVEEGRKALARDPRRISDAIGMLGGTQRQKMLAEDRLVAAGEYAAPQLLAALASTTDPAVELAVSRRLAGLKRYAVLPLAMSLRDLDPATQRKVVGILTEIAWPTAIPFILEVASAEGAPVDVKAACDVAFAQLGGTSDSVSAQFEALARKFFDREDSLIPYPADAVNNLWSFERSTGLQAEAVATEVFCDEMAMAMARRALAADSSNGAALALYVAADLRRENTLGSDAGVSRYSPQFFATAAGASVCSDVLALAIDSRDTALVRDAIAVLADVAGAGRMTAGGARNPLVEALGYSDRRVRLDAAIAIANAGPSSTFDSHFLVVPTLASALGEQGQPRAAVLGGMNEDRSAIAGQLSAAGFAVVASGDGFDALANDVVRANGVDLVVVRGAADELQAAVGRVRSSGLTSACPVLAIANAPEESAARRAFDGAAGVMVWTEGSTAESFRNAAGMIVSQVSGSAIDEAEAAEYAARAAMALNAIAVGRSQVFNLADAQPALLRALGAAQGGLRMMVAGVLAEYASPDAQRALIDAAIDAGGDEQVMLCDYAALAARKGGAAASDRQLSALRALIASSEGATADAAGRLYGSLDAGSAEAVKLIVD